MPNKKNKDFIAQLSARLQELETSLNRFVALRINQEGILKQTERTLRNMENDEISCSARIEEIKKLIGK